MQGMDGQRGRQLLRSIVNMFGAIGYTLLIAAYAIAAAVLLLWLIQGNHLAVLGVPPPVSTPPELLATAVAPEAAAPSWFGRLLLVLSAVLMMGAVVVVVVTLPYWLGLSGSSILKWLIRCCRWPVTVRSLLIAKVLACGTATVPSLLAWLYVIADPCVTLVQSSIVTTAMLLFLLQHYLAYRSEDITVDRLW